MTKAPTLLAFKIQLGHNKKKEHPDQQDALYAYKNGSLP